MNISFNATERDWKMPATSIKAQCSQRIKRSRRNVFWRKDFEDIGGYDQIGRALYQLIDDELIVRIGYGLYAKARRNSITNKVMASAKGGFNQIASEALKLLGVTWLPSQTYLDYKNRSTTQMPAREVYRIKGRLTRKIAVGNFELRYVNV